MQELVNNIQNVLYKVNSHHILTQITLDNVQQSKCTFEQEIIQANTKNRYYTLILLELSKVKNLAYCLFPYCTETKEALKFLNAKDFINNELEKLKSIKSKYGNVCLFVNWDQGKQEYWIPELKRMGLLDEFLTLFPETIFWIPSARRDIKWVSHVATTFPDYSKYFNKELVKDSECAVSFISYCGARVLIHFSVDVLHKLNQKGELDAVKIIEQVLLRLHYLVSLEVNKNSFKKKSTLVTEGSNVALGDKRPPLEQEKELEKLHLLSQQVFLNYELSRKHNDSIKKMIFCHVLDKIAIDWCELVTSLEKPSLHVALSNYGSLCFDKKQTDKELVKMYSDWTLQIVKSAFSCNTEFFCDFLFDFCEESIEMILFFSPLIFDMVMEQCPYKNKTRSRLEKSCHKFKLFVLFEKFADLLENHLELGLINETYLSTFEKTLFDFAKSKYTISSKYREMIKCLKCEPTLFKNMGIGKFAFCEVVISCNE